MPLFSKVISKSITNEAIFKYTIKIINICSIMGVFQGISEIYLIILFIISFLLIFFWFSYILFSFLFFLKGKNIMKNLILKKINIFFYYYNLFYNFIIYIPILEVLMGISSCKLAVFTKKDNYFNCDLNKNGVFQYVARIGIILAFIQSFLIIINSDSFMFYDTNFLSRRYSNVIIIEQ